MGKKENAIEQPVCDYAENRGFEVRKLKYEGHTGAPDRMFYGYGQVFFMEFKSPDPDARVKPWQKREIQKMNDAGICAFVIDDVEFGKILIDGAVISGSDYE